MTAALDRLSHCIGQPWQTMSSDEMQACLDALARGVQSEASREVEAALIEELSRRDAKADS